MKRTYVVFGLVFVILVGLLYIALRFDFDENVQGIFSDGGDSVESGNRDIIISRPDGSGGGEESFGEDDEGVGGEAGGAGGGSSGESDGGSSDGDDRDYCQQTIAYTMLDFSKSDDCLSFEGVNCVQKFVNCTVSVQNLDYNVGGEFTVLFNFKYVVEGSVLLNLTQSNFVQPREIVEFSREHIFVGEDAQKAIDCGFSTESAPTWVAC